MKRVKLGWIALDSTKIKANANANASKHKALSYGRANTIERQLRDELKALMQQAESADRNPSRGGLTLI